MVNHHIIKELTNVSKVHAIDCFCRMGWRHQPSPFVWLQQLLVTNTVHNLTGSCHLQSCVRGWNGTRYSNFRNPERKGKRTLLKLFPPSILCTMDPDWYPPSTGAATSWWPRHFCSYVGPIPSYHGPSEFRAVPSGSQHPLMGSSPTWGWRPSAAALPCLSCPLCCLAKLRCPGNPGHLHESVEEGRWPKMGHGWVHRFGHDSKWFKTQKEITSMDSSFGPSFHGHAQVHKKQWPTPSRGTARPPVDLLGQNATQ